jgi:hypothetical protein
MHGYVLTERMPIQFDHDRGQLMFYNEIYRGKINGQYVLALEGERFSGVYYLRKSDNKRIDLEIKE